jgi:hypothetical protein
VLTLLEAGASPNVLTVKGDSAVGVGRKLKKNNLRSSTQDMLQAAERSFRDQPWRDFQGDPDALEAQRERDAQGGWRSSVDRIYSLEGKPSSNALSDSLVLQVLAIAQSSSSSAAVAGAAIGDDDDDVANASSSSSDGGGGGVLLDEGGGGRGGEHGPSRRSLSLLLMKGSFEATQLVLQLNRNGTWLRRKGAPDPEFSLAVAAILVPAIEAALHVNPKATHLTPIPRNPETPKPESESES